ncbi:aspartic peptidase domain-containing protein [Phyllosticta citricarpa]|uniref:Aspartic peptidase domain-containing protein n=1 Tax=Phyllosticta citricarpa TaxID=55181 RepID=A0ABR1MLI2_9PEZI
MLAPLLLSSWARALVLFFSFSHALSDDGARLTRRQMAPDPIVLDPSQVWDGSEGLWSTFTLRVGTPAQLMRVHIAIGGQETWVVAPTGCVASDANGDECHSKRGGLFQANESSTWQSTTEIWDNSGIYGLGEVVLDGLGISGQGQYGFDVVGLNAGKSANLNRTIVAQFNTLEFYQGQFGVSPRPTNFTVENNNASSMNDPQPSYFSLLRDNNLIPSLTYSYTAGSYARTGSLRNAWASFIFGGYDAALLGPDKLSFDFTPDDGRELVVAIQSIQKTGSNGDVALLPTPVLAALDSSQANLWLPSESCELFESAFDITWNETLGLYLVNATVHERLVEENPNVTFSLGHSVSGGKTVDIVLPYSAFDLNASYPAIPGSGQERFFPLKRAANSTQITLGRTFLQEAYFIADYERHNFSLAQRVWNDSAASEIVAIRSVNSGSDSGPALSIGAIVGIVVGAAAIVVVVLVAFCIVRRRAKRRSFAKRTEENSNAAAFAMASQYKTIEELQGDDQRRESHALQYRMELPGDGKTEMPANEEVKSRVEIDGQETPAELSHERMNVNPHELPGDYPPAVEPTERKESRQT